LLADRKYVREAIPDGLWNAPADLSRRYPTSLVGLVLKLDPSRLKKPLIKRSARTPDRKKLQATFFQLPTESARRVNALQSWCRIRTTQSVSSLIFARPITLPSAVRVGRPSHHVVYSTFSQLWRAARRPRSRQSIHEKQS